MGELFQNFISIVKDQLLFIVEVETEEKYLSLEKISMNSKEWIKQNIVSKMPLLDVNLQLVIFVFLKTLNFFIIDIQSFLQISTPL